MRMIQAECSIIYDGRGHTELGRGIRTIPIKDDDTVIIHRKNGIKPANYMGAVSGIDADIDDTERRRQEWLSRNLTVFGESMMFAQREFQTGDGAIDLLGMDSSANGAVFVEVKRNAVKHDVYRIPRYRDAVMNAYDNRRSDFLPSEAMMDMSVRPIFILASENDTKSMIDECGNHDTYHVNNGTRWRDESVDSITARRVE